VETVDSSGDAGKFTSIALDSSGNPHISYVDYTVWNSYDLKYAYLSGDTWYISTLDSASHVKTNTSIALDSHDNPHVSYFDEDSDDLKYTYYDGDSWNTETVDSTDDVGRNSSIELDSSDRPRISYFDNTNNAMKYARHDGTTWNIESADSAGNTVLQTSLALDSHENPHVAYYDDDNKDLKYATLVCAYPSAPAASDPGDSVESGVEYTVSWPAVGGASEYVIEEALSDGFSDVSERRTVTGLSTSYTHDSAGTAYYYRVKARGSCGSVSDWSAVVDITVSAVAKKNSAYMGLLLLDQ
jgi:hypothetical protein